MKKRLLMLVLTIAVLMLPVVVSAAPGDQSEPIVLEDSEPQSMDVFTDEITQDGTVYYTIPGAWDNYNLTVSGAGLTSVAYGRQVENATDNTAVVNGVSGNPRMGLVTFAVTGTGTFSVELAPPVGTEFYPDTLVLGFGSVTTTGYYYNFTAPENGIFTVNMECAEWTRDVYVDYADAAMIYSDEEGASPKAQLYVEKDEVVTLFVAPLGWEAAEVSFFTSFAGYEGNPIIVEDSNWDTSAIEYTTPSQEGSLYYSVSAMNPLDVVISGEGLVSVTYGEKYTPVNGVVTIPGVQGMGRMPAVLVVEGTGVFDMIMTPPYGSMDNPADLPLGDFTATDVAVEGYFYTWTATCPGTLTVTMKSDDWTLTLGNNDMLYSADGVNTDSVDVVAGDELMVIISPEGWDPADIKFNASFAHDIEELTFVEEDPATLEGPGVAAHYFCENCEKYYKIAVDDSLVEVEYEDLTIPKLQESPKVGDTNVVLVYVVLAVLSVVAFVGVYNKKRLA